MYFARRGKNQQVLRESRRGGGLKGLQLGRANCALQNSAGIGGIRGFG